MIWILLTILLSLFGLAVGIFIGAGNYSGFKGAIIPGIIAGVVASIPAIREQQWDFVWLTSVCALVGSIICVYIPDTNATKQFFREQESLCLHFGSYKLGRMTKGGS